MACTSGRDSRTMGRYEGSDNYQPGLPGGACETGCFNGDSMNSGNTCSSCSGDDCVAGCGECSVDCGPKRTCDTDCTGDCDSCTGYCGGCDDSCSSCEGSCSGGCSGTCTTACAEQCSGTCSGGCIGHCNNGCTSEEVNELEKNLHISRIAESDDINNLKKVIYRLFENLKVSKIYNDKNYINEFGDNSVAGLVSNWNEDENGKMTYTMLLNKTFETIITNLNNLNQGRIVLEQDKMNPIKIWDVEVPDPDDFTKTKIIHLNTVDRNAALYWIESVKKIFALTAPVK